MNYWAILIRGLLSVLRTYWQDRNLNLKLPISDRVIILLSITSLAVSSSYRTTSIVGWISIVVVSSIAIILATKQQSSWRNRIDRSIRIQRVLRQPLWIWMILGVISAIGLLCGSGVNEIWRLALISVVVCLGISIAMTRWIQLRAWVMTGIISSTLIGSIQFEGCFPLQRWRRLKRSPLVPI